MKDKALRKIVALVRIHNLKKGFPQKYREHTEFENNRLGLTESGRDDTEKCNVAFRQMSQPSSLTGPANV